MPERTRSRSEIPFEFGQDGYQRNDELSLWRAEIELQAYQGNAPHLEFAQRMKQIDRRAPPAGQLGHQNESVPAQGWKPPASWAARAGASGK